MNMISKSYVYEGDLQSDLFQISCNGASVPICVFPGIDYARCQKVSRQYQQQPHDNMKLPAKDMAVHYMHVQLSPDSVETQITLTAPEPILQYSIHPTRDAIQGRVDGTRLTFTISEKQRYLLIAINDLPMVCLILETDRATVPALSDESVVSIQQYVPSDAIIDDYTDVFERAITALNGSHKTLYIPKGTYITDTILIRECADFSIYFADDCLVKTKISAPGSHEKSAGIWIDSSSNIRLFGRGCLDQQSYEQFANFRNDYAHNFVSNEFYQNVEPVAADDPLLTSALLITCSSNIEVNDMTFRNGRCWNISCKGSDRLSFSHCKVITPPASLAEWADGFNFGGCHQVRLKDCLTYCNDDCFAGAHCLAPYDTGGGSDFLIEGLVGYTARAHAVRLGWACQWAQGDFIFRHCDFIRSTKVLVHELKDRSGNTLPYGAVRFEDCGFDGPVSFGIDSTAMDHLEFEDVTWEQVMNPTSNNRAPSNLKMTHCKAGSQALTGSDCGSMVKNYE